MYDNIAQWLPIYGMLALMRASKDFNDIMQSFLARNYPGLTKRQQRSNAAALQVLGAKDIEADADLQRAWGKIISGKPYQWRYKQTAREIIMRSDQQALRLLNTHSKTTRTILAMLAASDIKHLRLEVAEPILKEKFLLALQELLATGKMSVCFQVLNAGHLSAELLQVLKDSPKAVRLELRCALAQVPAKCRGALGAAIASDSVRSLLLFLDKQQGEHEALALRALRGHKTLTHLNLILPDAKVGSELIETIPEIPNLRTLNLSALLMAKASGQIGNLSSLLDAINACDTLTSVNLRLSKRGAPVFSSEPLSARANSKLTNNLSMSIGGLKNADVITAAQVLKKNRSLVELSLDTHRTLDAQANQALAELLSSHPTLVRLRLHSGKNRSKEDVMRHYEGLIGALPSMGAGKEVTVVIGADGQTTEFNFSSGMPRAGTPTRPGRVALPAPDSLIPPMHPAGGQDRNRSGAGTAA